MRAAALAGCALGLFCAADRAPGGGASAREDGAARKSHHSQPARTGQASLDRTGSIAKPSSQRVIPDAPTRDAAASIAGDEGPLLPVLLPNVPRSRMIACGETWRSMKMNGTTGDDSWRDFALKCLVAAEVPTP